MSIEKNRIYYMDAMRSILMMLGVVLHSAKVYNPDQSWIIFSDHTTDVAKYLVEIIHKFRMPSFFIISGFFCVLTIKKYKPTKFIYTRLQRILIPLLTTALTLNTIQTLILTSSGWEKFEIINYLETGKWVSHLWFLNNLIVYFSLVFICSITIKKQTRIALNSNASLFSLIPVEILIFILPVASIAILFLNKIGFPLYTDFFGIFDVFSLLSHLPYFVFGGLLFINRNLLKNFSTINPLIVATITVIFILVRNSAYFKLLPYPFNSVLSSYLNILSTWLMVAFVFYIFYKYTNKKSEAFCFFSEASYTVYLFHHVIIVFVGILLIKIKMPVFPGLFILITVGIIFPLLIHKLFILKYNYLRYLFNGKYNTKTATKDVVCNGGVRIEPNSITVYK